MTPKKPVNLVHGMVICLMTGANTLFVMMRTTEPVFRILSGVVAGALFVFTFLIASGILLKWASRNRRAPK
ncbi:hypothetical protein [Nitrospirillum iridis]|uniref:Uncharacterized protein n=1 Tax=Nitrospirillum iridis TaxID=765888 RepID=A0A7X0B2C7_9PROT|nr:hypothetical protein [Nitrospirillum iridis]MBB6253736.1 hypothetical protein [Nitrospirillum iridis]